MKKKKNEDSENLSLLTDEKIDEKIKGKKTEDADFSNGYSQWAVSQDGSYIPTFKTTKKVPAGVYEICFSTTIGHYLQMQKVVHGDNLLQLPIPEMEEILGDIESFWKMKEQFVKYKMVYKRGILMHGQPGCGKSYLIQNIINNIISLDGICLSLNGEGQVSLFTDFIQKLRQIEPERPIVVIIEDIDNIVTAGQGLLSALLNVLDGVNQIDNVVYLATTNYPERLQDRISNRPSRFDRVYEIGVPNAKVREYYINNKLHKDDLSKIDMKKWVKETEGLSLSHIKELIASTMIFDKPFDKVLEHFSEMKRPKSSRSASAKIGFGSN